MDDVTKFNQWALIAVMSVFVVLPTVAMAVAVFLARKGKGEGDP